VSVREMLDDQLVNGRCFVHVGGAERDRVGSGIGDHEPAVRDQDRRCP
jgi:hypothetical protein